MFIINRILTKYRNVDAIGFLSIVVDSRHPSLSSHRYNGLNGCQRFLTSQSVKCKDCKYKIAIIGSGPAGFYTSQQLLKYPNLNIDIYEKFPVPFGLVRFGVAPDHQEVKNVINSFTKVANNERTRFIGNINIGTDVTFQELRDAYHAVVLCYGSSQDAMLNIPGESLANVISARRFVGWYNGIPQDKDLELSLNTSCGTAIIIGQGNVALDCARILLTPSDILKKTDITSHAFRKLSSANIRQVVIIGRRGPLQSAFKIKEFRELTKMADCHVRFDWPEWIREHLDFNDKLIQSLPRSRRRLAELCGRIIDESNERRNCSKECLFKFFLTPIEICSGSNGRMVGSVRLKRNRLDDYVREDSKIISTCDDELIEEPCGILIRSIGYRSVPLDPSLPFDHRRGIILNEQGRVNDNPDLYCSGWAAFGATGVILNTMTASFEVGKNILRDIQDGLLDGVTTKRGYDQIRPLLDERQANTIDFVDWTRIDQFEREQGRKEGKPREKIVSMDQILDY
ncbi:NADPH:adrenodoxin oxidoreductase, mitochondrial-like protein [Euroglyphus maynei]|uniref:NADPH:adrenodoxin oxidoreductase, mitochondrial n=1 Tax=Euroglyphus maynei TaxID=6958 RepID=A0A1Y3B574_EURMA|nr:NADPH:adrenodoxin oxidoreductase, mitochondrial-like protein [Euroglyphus maynei]